MVELDVVVAPVVFDVEHGRGLQDVVHIVHWSPTAPIPITT